MSDQVGNPEDRFSHNKAHMIVFYFSLVFSQSLLSLDIIEDFLAHIDEMNQNPEDKKDEDKKEGDKKDEGKKLDKKGKENGEVAGGSGAGGSGADAGGSRDGPEKKEDKVRL